MNMISNHIEDIKSKKEEAALWFANIRDQICSGLEALEAEFGGIGKFKYKEWSREGGGGGTSSIMHGDIFEKAGVNISTVHGTLSEKFAAEIPGAEEDKSFWASGVSLVIHPRSPLVPAIHMNTRMIVTSKLWFGGGIDLTPAIEVADDVTSFHSCLKETCDRHDARYYQKFKEYCDKYFYIQHRAEPRGAGGIFYDYLNTGDWQKDFEFTKDVGRAFLKSYAPIVKRNAALRWTDEQKQTQLLKRGRYVEFNLIYDRGTRFGLMTGGNIDAILMSMPPEAKWS